MLKSKTLSYFGHTAKLLDDPRYDKFYNKLVDQRWEPETFDILARMVDVDTTYIDIGAWIGVTPLWAASRARQVVAVEPDPFCTQVLRFLIAENGSTNITLMEGALATERKVELAEVGGFGSSESSLLAPKGKNAVSVAGITVEDILKQAGPGAKFCKVDIEGFEYEIIDMLIELAEPKMKAVQLAIHPQLLMRAREWPPVLARFRAALQTWHLVRRLQSHGLRVVAKGGSPLSYILRNIVFAWKVRGTDLIISRVGGSRDDLQFSLGDRVND